MVDEDEAGLEDVEGSPDLEGHLGLELFRTSISVVHGTLNSILRAPRPGGRRGDTGRYSEPTCARRGARL